MRGKMDGLYGVVCGILLLLVAALVSFSAVTVEDGAEMAAQLPRAVELKRHFYGNYEQKKSDIIMNRNIGRLIITGISKSKYRVEYGEGKGDYNLDSIYIKDGLARYKLVSASRGSGWTIELCRPVSQGEQQIVGKWAFCMRGDNGNISSEWFIFKEDGTGILGWGEMDAVAAPEQELAEKCIDFTWKVDPLGDGGALVVGSIQNGEIVVLVKM